MNEKTLKIGWLFPDSLYLHGDRGNVLAMKRMGESAGFNVEIEKIDFDTDDFTPTDYDFIICPPGEIAVFASIIEWLRPYTLSLKAYIQMGRPLLVTGNSIGLWGNTILRDDGSTIKGLEILDITTKENPAIYGDDLYFKCTVGEQSMEILGCQIQMADITLGDELSFGHLYYGYGNTGKDRQEGVQIKNSVFTNTLGPILVTNPWLTKSFVEIIAQNQEVSLDNWQVDMQLEMLSLKTKKQFITNKATDLTNCPRGKA